MAMDQVASLPFLSPLTLSLFSFPSGDSSLAATVLGHCSLTGRGPSALSTGVPGSGCARLFLIPSRHHHHPAPRDLVHITVPGACTFGIGAFSFWQPSYQSFFCSSVLFKVYCLPKMTSLRCSRWGVSADSSADFNVRSAQ